jgi:DUF1680 family protein
VVRRGLPAGPRRAAGRARAGALDGIGQTIEITAEGQLLPADTPVTAIAIPYFQWDNRDGRPMRVWMPRAC